MISGIYDFTSTYDRRLLMMRVLEGVNARIDMAENVDQIVSLSGRTSIGMCYALGLKLRKDKNGKPLQPKFDAIYRFFISSPG